MSQKPFILRNVKQKFTRNLNALLNLLQEAEEFREPWNFPTKVHEMDVFLVSKKRIIINLMSKLQQRREETSEYYATCNQVIHDLIQDEKADIEDQFDTYWSEKRGDDLLNQSDDVERKLEKRLIELECNLKYELTQDRSEPDPSQHPSINPQALASNNSWMMERRLMGNELKIPDFYGNPSEFASFWELFEELVHRQPYSNIEKLSILINCCKGDAARTLQMIPRTGESYDRAVTQLKNQYLDPRRITMQMIRQLKAIKQCRSLRNNLSDVQAIIATLEKQGEAVNTTNMRSRVLDTFSKSMQDEMAKREFDTGTVWTMEELLDNLSIAVKRKEHVDGLRESHQDEHSVFHSSTTVVPTPRCTGCGRHNTNFNIATSIKTSLRRLDVYAKLMLVGSVSVVDTFCRKQNYPYCGGLHNPVICRKRSRIPNEKGFNHFRQREVSPFQRRRGYTSSYSRRYSHSLGTIFRSRSCSPNSRSYSKSQPTRRNRNFNYTRRNEQSPLRTPSGSPTRTSPNRSTIKHSPSPRRSPEQHHRVRFQQSPTLRRRSFENVTVNLQIQNDAVIANINNELTSGFSNSEYVRLMVVPIEVQSPKTKEKETVFALLDSALGQYFVSTSLANRMNLSIQNESTIVLNTFGGKAKKKRVKRVVTPLYNKDGDHITFEFLTNDKITLPLRLAYITPEDEAYLRQNLSNEELQWISQAANGTVIPEILIGMDYYNAVMKLHEPVIQLPSGCLITSTFFGPVISGVPHGSEEQSEEDNFYKRLVHTCCISGSCNNHFDIPELWKLSTIGIEDSRFKH